ncbi:MAG: flagellar biosynthesis protein FlgA [Anaerolineales bacterium]|nr:MAG: flagellar biosynthesis protein FlgA [Anaerolineales bacterium]
MSMRDDLIEYEQNNGPIRVGLIGAGQMGTGLMSQMEKMDGMQVVAVADVIPNRAEAAYVEASVEKSLVRSVESSLSEAELAVQEGLRIATRSFDMMIEMASLDVIVEATGIPEIGAIACQAAILSGKHVVNMNVETDATIGYYLAELGRAAGVVYTLAAGDEPGAIKEIYDFADALGFEIVCVGKGKNNPLDRSANPDKLAEQARQKNMSAKMLASFVDGTKTMVEMTSAGNATGFAPEIRGAHGPKCSVADLPKLFVPKADGGILEGKLAVDYAIGPAPGVFVIITTDQPKIIADLRYLGLNGHGDYWSLYRPYHLANLETPISIARAVLYDEETIATHKPPVAETITAAKKDLKPGDVIDGLGGFSVYGMIEKAEVAKAENLLPLGLAPGAKVRKNIKTGEALTYEDVEIDNSLTIAHLRFLQDRIVEKQKALNV